MKISIRLQKPAVEALADWIDGQLRSGNPKPNVSAFVNLCMIRQSAGNPKRKRK